MQGNAMTTTPASVDPKSTNPMVCWRRLTRASGSGCSAVGLIRIRGARKSFQAARKAKSPTVAVVSLGTEKLAESGPGTVELTRTWSAGDRLVLKMAMPPRATVPDPRIDAVRGTIALERGPLVYAVEDADLPAGTSVESLEVAASPDLEAAVESEPSLGELTWLSLDATIRDDSPGRKWPYRHGHNAPASLTSGKQTKVRALPYFAWGNRAGLGMRIWLPTRPRKEGT